MYVLIINKLSPVKAAMSMIVIFVNHNLSKIDWSVVSVVKDIKILSICLAVNLTVSVMIVCWKNIETAQVKK